MATLTPARAARRQRARVAHWLARAVTEALRLGAGPAELRRLAAVAQRLKLRAVQAPPAAGAIPHHPGRDRPAPGNLARLVRALQHPVRAAPAGGRQARCRERDALGLILVLGSIGIMLMNHQFRFRGS
jgi:hypothetical protein